MALSFASLRMVTKYLPVWRLRA